MTPDTLDLFAGPGGWSEGLRHYHGIHDYEMRPSEREDEWLAAHRFDLDTALELAKATAPNVTVNGFTVEKALAMYASEVVE